MSSKFCPSCGAARQSDVRFCGACGAALSDTAGESSAPPSRVGGGMPDVRAAAAAALPSPLSPHGWHVVVGEQLPAFAAATASGDTVGMARTAAQALPKSSSLRGVVLQLLLVTGADWAAAYATRDPAALQLANVRAGIAIVTTLLGMVAGRGRGVFSKLTMLSSLALAVAQSPSLLSFGQRILANPAMLSPLLPNVATQGLSLLAALRTVLAARK